MESKSKSPTMSPDILLYELSDAVAQINKKLDRLIEISERNLKMQESQQRIIENGYPSEFKIEPDPMSLLSLPLSLRKTIMVLYKLEKATAADLAKETNRLRAVESAAANQLVRMGYLRKKRESREVFFYIESPMELRK